MKDKGEYYKQEEDDDDINNISNNRNIMINKWIKKKYEVETIFHLLVLLMHPNIYNKWLLDVDDRNNN